MWSNISFCFHLEDEGVHVDTTKLYTYIHHLFRSNFHKTVALYACYKGQFTRVTKGCEKILRFLMEMGGGLKTMTKRNPSYCFKSLSHGT